MHESSRLKYEYQDMPSAGLRFPCTEQGKVLPMAPAARVAYRKCLHGTLGRPIVFRGIHRHEQRYRLPAAIECEACSGEVNLTDPMTNKCECGAFYNGSGQRLTDPSLWGEETGERFDCHGALIY